MSNIIENHLKEKVEPQKSQDVIDVIDAFWKKQPSIGEILAFIDFVPE